MSCSSSRVAQRRFVRRSFGAAGLCILFSVLAAVGFIFGHLSGFVAYLVAVLPALPILWALFITGTYLTEETDEFQRNLLVQSLLGGIGLTLSAITIWGNLEVFAHTPHLHLGWVYPMFWLFVGLSYPVVRMRYR